MYIYIYIYMSGGCVQFSSVVQYVSSTRVEMLDDTVSDNA